MKLNCWIRVKRIMGLDYYNELIHGSLIDVKLKDGTVLYNCNLRIGAFRTDPYYCKTIIAWRTVVED